MLNNEHERLSKYASASQFLNPEQILKRGYTITYQNGKIVKNIKGLKVGDSIENKWIDGKASSTVNEINDPKPLNKGL